ncbi:hypothetical protein OG410_00850 [Streptomyces sp. NBC_00659]|uniref:tetrahydrofolate dehydrogenase/cyclohydrolase catalytic domain-containing protein n=1 Tax=Streptomyces sp. NBC_00659 TaxID=2903669 RepID=UPI002E2FB8EC|nr:tetrahydrofolate dehydrogenase/cyclohydrolase catalytic domain-containing protein [Streptomyces sp. NBC_00659]
MTAQLLDGKATTAAIRRELAERVAKSTAAGGRPPGLGTVLADDDPGSRAHVGGKHRNCAQTGVASIRRELPADATQAEAVIDEPDADLTCTGHIVQDVGITRTDLGLVGDVHPDAASVAGWLAPMPGGVGPMTRTVLLANVVEAAERNANAV